jgi:hypothetical protein
MMKKPPEIKQLTNRKQGEPLRTWPWLSRQLSGILLFQFPRKTYCSERDQWRDQEEIRDVKVCAAEKILAHTEHSECKAWRTVHISAARGIVLPPGVPITHVSWCGNVSFWLASSKTWGKKIWRYLRRKDYMLSSLNYTKRLPPGRAGPLRDLRRKGNTSSS